MADPRKPFAPPGAAPAVDSDQAFLDRMGIVRPRTGMAGVPKVGGVGGGVAAQPQSPRPPAPVGVAGAPPGRPPAAPAPNSGPFIPPVTEAPTPAAPASPQAAQPQPTGAQAAPAAAPQQIDSAGRAFTAPRVAVPKMPSRFELEQMDPNAVVDTPYGQMVTNPESGRRELVFSPEGKQAYAAEQQRIRSKFGPNPFRNLPGAPQMEVEPGKPAFDPFSGRWIS